jgi:hypothetical protein
MTLEETVLQKLADWRTAGEGRHQLVVPHAASGWAVHVTADRQDELSCSAWELVLQRTRDEAGSPRRVGDWAKATATSVTSLLEALCVVEVDERRDEALLRSKEPTKRQESLYYYELLLKGTRQGTVRRFRASHEGERREQVPFTLTHEAIAKLAADIAA